MAEQQASSWAERKRLTWFFVEFPDFCFGRLSPEVEAELEILTLVSFEF